MWKLTGFLLVIAGLTKAHESQESTLLSPIASHVPGVEGSGRGYGPIPSAILPGLVECKEETFLPDPTDPTKFYRCVETVKGDFEVFKFWCRDGRKWDQERQVCRYELPLPKPLPKSVEAEKVGGSSFVNIACKNEGFLPDPADPTRFYRCLETVQGPFKVFQFWCRDGRKWDQERQVCRYDSLVPNHLPTPGNAEEIGTESSPNIECIKEGFVPDPTDPTRFYKCVETTKGRFVAFEFRCSDRMNWDQERQECRYDPLVPRPLPKSYQSTGLPDKHHPHHHQAFPELAMLLPGQVNLRISPESTEASSSSESTSSSASSSSSEEQTKPNMPETLEPEALLECQKEGFMPHPNDPTKFYKCMQLIQGGFKLFQFWCNEGRKWDQERHVCRYDSIVPKPLPKAHAPESQATPDNEGEKNDTPLLTTTARNHDKDNEKSEESTSASKENSDQETIEKNESQQPPDNDTTQQSSLEGESEAETDTQLPPIQGNSEEDLTQEKSEGDITEKLPIEQVSDEETDTEQPPNQGNSEEKVTQEPPVSEKSEEKITEKPPAEEASEEETDTEKPPIQGNSEEKFTEEPPVSEKSKEDINEEPPAEEASPEETDTEQPPIRGNSEEKVTEEPPVSEKSQEDITEKSPAEEASPEETDTEQPPIQGNSEEKVTQEPPVSEKSEEKITEKPPAEEASEEETDTEKPPIQGNSEEKLTEEPPVSEKSEEDITEKPPAEEASPEETDTEQPPIRGNSEEKVTEEPPVSEKSQEDITEKSPAEEASPEETDTEQPPIHGNSEEKVTEEPPVSEKSQEDITEKSPAEETSPEETDTEQPPIRGNSEEKVTEEPPVSEKSEEKITEKPPVEEVSEEETDTEQPPIRGNSEEKKTEEPPVSEKSEEKITEKPPVEGGNEEKTSEEPPIDGNTSEERKPEQPETKGSGSDSSESSESSTSASSESSEEKKPFIECTEEGFFPDSLDSMKFYRCVQFGLIFLKYEFICPLGTIWDDRVKTCNFPYAVEEQGPPSDNQPIREADSTQVLCPIAKLAGETTVLTCPSGFGRHPKYCNLFYQCTNVSGFKSVVLFRCPHGRIFDEERTMCIMTVRKNRRNCSIYEPPSRKSTHTSLINAPPTTRLCPAKGRFAFGRRCPNTYVECEHNEKRQLVGRLVTCPNQHIFSPVKAECLFYKRMPLCKKRFPVGDSFPLSDYEALYVGTTAPQQV